MKKNQIQASLLTTLGAFAWGGFLSNPAQAGEVILQYFESKWTTIERRMPDVFMAGYDSIWVPPPGVADTGGFSVGYDVFDRFNLGTPFSPTLYGTEEAFLRMSEEMDRAGLDLYIDAVLNHNGFRDSSTAGFVEEGDYPGFVTTLPGDPDGDFHSAFDGGDLNGRLAGLIDIAQEKNHLFIRHPVPGFSNLIPNETPRESNRQFYPDQDLAMEFGRHPFNTENPLEGDPVEENATGLLLRYVQWMIEVNGVDGFRLDATKHIPTFFFNDFYDGALNNIGRNPISGDPVTPFSFGENLDGDWGRLAAYVRKDGFGNRDTLDFPLYFAMRDVFNAGGFGDMRSLEFASFDGYDGTPNNGSLGVIFAGSHDSFAGGKFNGFGNLPHAHILTRTGLPIVYYNAKEFGDGRDFPKDGRGDALGNFGDTITRLVDLNDEYIRNGHATRWIDEDVYIYERVRQAVVGLNDRGDSGYDERTVQTAFPEGTVLVELTGNATDPLVDPGDDLFDSVTVNASGQVTIRVPRNQASGTDDFHGRGYVAYGPAAPPSTLTIANAASTIGPDPDDGRPQAVRRLTPLEVVTGDTIDVELSVDASDDTPNDNALIKVNFGELDVDGDGNRTATGEFAGFESFPEAGQPTGPSNALRTYTASLDATQLDEGYTYIETAAFLERPEGTQAIFDGQRKVVYLDRLPPEQNLILPTQTGMDDITTRDFEAVVETHHTADSVHILTNVPAGATDQDILNLVSGDNSARQHDRLEWRRVLSGLPVGLNELTVVAFEETGNVSIERYGNIDVDPALPELEIGIDADKGPSSSNFQPLPGNINAAALEEEILIRVKTNEIDGQGTDISFPADYTVSLIVDEGPEIDAEPFDSGLLPPVGILVQNDQNLGDEFDEFRFAWRGYGTGNHSFRAKAELTESADPPNEVLGSINVSQETEGPAITVTLPAPPEETVDDPSFIAVEGTLDDDLAAFAQAFIDGDEAAESLGQINNPSAGSFRFEKPAESFARVDILPPGSIDVSSGSFPVRVIASTGPNGSGISSEAGSSWNITGVPTLPELPQVQADGSSSDTLDGTVLATSAADGGTGTGNPADFGSDGTLTELRAVVRDRTLYIALRGDMFGEDEGAVNASFLLIDVDAGEGTGSTDLATDLSDTSDGLRTQISELPFGLDSSLQTAGLGIDAVVGITEPEIGFGYTLGTGGTDGSFSELAFQEGIVTAYDTDASAFPAAPGTTIAGPNNIEISIPFSALGDPDPADIRLAAVTSSDDAYASPNTLPENSSDAFDAAPNFQVLEEMASLPQTEALLINEVFTGNIDLVEIYNPGASVIDLTDWTLRAYDSAGVRSDFTFPGGSQIDAGQYLVISDEGGINPPSSGEADIFIGANIPWDQTRGGAAVLIDPLGFGKDYAEWLDTSGDPASLVRAIPFPETWSGEKAGAASRLQGHSFARNASSTDTGSSGDWEATSGADSDGPTFGAANLDGQITPPDSWILK